MAQGLIEMNHTIRIFVKLTNNKILYRLVNIHQVLSLIKSQIRLFGRIKFINKGLLITCRFIRTYTVAIV